MAVEEKNAVKASAETFKVRGNDFLKEGRLAEAVEAYSQAIEVDPSTAALWTNRSVAHLKAGNALGALADADEAARLEPTWTKGHLRRARALEALGRLVEASLACGQGEVAATNGKQLAEAREFRKLCAEFTSSAAEKILQGWWHGTVSQTLGGYCQEFQFGSQGSLECVVYGNPLSGRYVLKDVEVTANQGFRGGLDVSLQGTDVPYLFKVGDGDVNLHLCCPMSGPLRPRTFDGPGFVAMCRGREQSEAEGADPSTEGQRVLQYVNELAEVMEMQDDLTRGRGGGAAMAQCLEEEQSVGDTISASALSGPDTLEDKKNRMASQQRMAALEIKFPPSVKETAQRLIKGELKASDVYPSEPWELEKRLRIFQRRRDEEHVESDNEDAAAIENGPEGTHAAPTAAEEQSISPQVAAATATVAATAEPKPSELQTHRAPAPTASCLSGCFRGATHAKQTGKAA